MNILAQTRRPEIRNDIRQWLATHKDVTRLEVHIDIACCMLVRQVFQDGEKHQIGLCVNWLSCEIVVK